MKFRCPQCEQKLECGTISQGWTAWCPRCGAKIVRSDVMLEMAAPEGRRGERNPGSGDGDAAGRGASEEAGAAPANVLATGPASRYEVGEVLGRGGAGVVVDARDVNIRRHIAMKVLRAPEGATQEQVLRFIEEAQITGQLEHPGVVPIYELGEDEGGNVFYTMKQVHGENLRTILDRIGSGDAAAIREYPLSRLLNIFQRVCDAVAFAHSRRVIHRDLKPDNVMIGEYGEVQVMDWGLAKTLSRKRGHAARGSGKSQGRGYGRGEHSIPESEKEKTVRLEIDSVRRTGSGEAWQTISGDVLGTPGFMPPEQANGDSESMDERSDIYSLGGILYYILALAPPFDGDTVEEVLERTREGELVAPEIHVRTHRGRPPAHCPGGTVPKSLSAVAMKALSLHPRHRYASVKDLQHEIEAYQQGFVTSAEQASVWKSAGLFVKRHKGATATAGVVAAVLAGVVAASFTINYRERVRAEDALAKYQEAESGRRKDRRQAAPALVETARMLVDRNELESALTTSGTAVEYDPDLAEARLLYCLLLICRGETRRALPHAYHYLGLRANDPDGGLLLQVCRDESRDGKAWYGSLADLCQRHGVATLGAMLAKTSETRLVAYRAKVENAFPGQSQYLRTTPDGELALSLNGGDARTLERLKGIPLRVLALTGTSIRNLQPLEGLPLTSLTLTDMKELEDLGAVKGMPLRGLILQRCRGVDDFTFLKELKLTSFACRGDYTSRPRFRDLSLLHGQSLKEIDISGSHVTELAPLKGMRLESLSLRLVKVVDLRPLSGMPMKSLDLSYAGVSNVQPLCGMPLESLSLMQTKVSDLSALKGMPLRNLDIRGCPFSGDLSPLYGMKSLVALQVDMDRVLEKSNAALDAGDLAGLRAEASGWKEGLTGVPGAMAIRQIAELVLEETLPLLEKHKQTGEIKELPEFGGHHYVLVGVPALWARAKTFCERAGGHLATITSREEQEWVTKRFAGKSDALMFGGFAPAGSNSWSWANGEVWDYEKWGRGQPDIASKVGKLVVLQRDGGWNDTESHRKWPFLMEWDR